MELDRKELGKGFAVVLVVAMGLIQCSVQCFFFLVQIHINKLPLFFKYYPAVAIHASFS